MKNDIVSDEKINWKVIADPLLDTFSPQFSLLLNLLSKKKDEKDNEIDKLINSPLSLIRNDLCKKTKLSPNLNFQIKCIIY